MFRGFSDRIASLAAVVWLTACGGPPSGPATGDIDDPGAHPAMLTDESTSSGLHFVHFNGMSGELYFAEIMGAGGAFLDFDNDGDLDVFLVQGAMLGSGKSLSEATYAPEADSPTDRLFRNQLIETGRLSFVDVTAQSGIVSNGYGMGVAVADYDRDGRLDLYVTNLGSNRLFRNRGDGTFEDVTAASGSDDARWSASAAFIDHDRDGWPDLFVCNYVDYNVDLDKPCRGSSGRQDYCTPSTFRPSPDRLLRNRGDGTFQDVTASTGIAVAPGAGLGVVSTDFNADGLPDLFVANDGMQNRLWIQTPTGRFEDQALVSGCAFNREGRPEASMGVNAADFDEDGDPDLFLTHLALETNTIYRNDGSGRFSDVTARSGLGLASHAPTGFGTAAVDLDRDGWLDLVVANGAVTQIQRRVALGEPYPMQQQNQLFHNLGGGVFEELTASAGAVFDLEEVGRGLAAGDVDNDGDPDLLLTNNSGPVRLLINRWNPDHRWIGLRLLDADGLPDPPGARVEVVLDDGRVLHRWPGRSGSYLSSGDPRLLIGLGVERSAARIRIYWPDGTSESWTGLEAGSYHLLRHGSGVAGPG